MQYDVFLYSTDMQSAVNFDKFLAVLYIDITFVFILSIMVSRKRYVCDTVAVIYSFLSCGILKNNYLVSLYK